MSMRSLTGRLFVFFVVALMLPLSVSAAGLSVSPSSVTAEAYVGQNATSQTAEVTKSGQWSVVQGANWLSVSPTSGPNSATLTLSFLTSALAAWQYNTSVHRSEQCGLGDGVRAGERGHASDPGGSHTHRHLPGKQHRRTSTDAPSTYAPKNLSTQAPNPPFALHRCNAVRRRAWAKINSGATC
jgi:hypothetical protein